TAAPAADWEQGMDNERQLLVSRDIMTQEPILLPAVKDNPVLHERVVQKKAPTKRVPLTAASPTVKAALDKHKRDSQALFDILKAGRNDPNTPYGIRWSNACEWLLSGRTPVHALTRTHDSAARATAQGAKGDVAYFGVIDQIPNASDYDFNDPKSTRNINISGQGVAGWQWGANGIAIMEPAGQAVSNIQDF